MRARLDDLGAMLTERLSATSVAWQDDSHLHAGHAGAREGGHYRVQIVSPRFAGLSRIARHRLIYDALGPLADRGIHALQIDARSPEEP